MDYQLFNLEMKEQGHAEIAPLSNLQGMQRSLETKEPHAFQIVRKEKIVVKDAKHVVVLEMRILEGW